ncbi:hypothetical protein FAF44_39600 [Nonomuraea sp. MG754425]|uniref:hypothetical protein n=1 Tax=Nonomuraea sp. MG754425 TaxID=2570319 RepID=UPI001F1C5673|nr:hypothetical protein [Nonomuraea sp. MG754425]MCF6474445.1 hypothetical protein [Nonomuraea sp. MG754425]
MGSAVFVTLAVALGAVAALLSGIVLSVLGAGALAAVSGGGGAFVAITTLSLLVIQLVGGFERRR